MTTSRGAMSPGPDAPLPAPDDELAPQATAEGTFARTPLVHLLVYSLDQSLTGTTVFHPPSGASHAVYFHEGVPSKIRTGTVVSPLDRVLLELRLLDEDTLRTTLFEIAKSRSLHGVHLVAKGLIAHSTLLEALRVQLAHKLAYLVELPPETRYYYYTGVNLIESYGGPELTPCEPLAAIMTGVRLRAAEALVESTLQRMTARPLCISTEGDARRFELQREEQDIVDLLRIQPMTLSTLIASQVAPEQVIRATIYALAITRYVHLGTPVKPPVGGAWPRRGLASDLPPASVGPRSTRSSVSPSSWLPPLPGTQSPRVVVAPTSWRPSTERASAPPMLEPPPAPAPPSPEILARRAEVEKRAATIDGEDHFQVLGLGREATTEDVRNSYFQNAKVWHPDRLQGALVDLKPVLARIFARVSEAYQTLVDPARRTAYVETLKNEELMPDEQAVVERVLDAASEFQKAELLLKKWDLVGAEKCASNAVEADPMQREYRTLLAWIRGQLRSDPTLPEGAVSDHLDDLVRVLDAVLVAEPEYERALFYRGILLKRAGKAEKAFRDFRAVLEKNPRNIDAAREVRLYEMRRRGAPPPAPPEGGGSGGGGLLGRLFKR